MRDPHGRHSAYEPEGLVGDDVEVVDAPLGEGFRELDRRSGNGMHVVLAWEQETNRVFVVVVDERSGHEFGIEVDPARALDAFYHPFAYEGGSSHDEYVVAEL